MPLQPSLASSAPPPAGSRLRRLTDEDASPIASAYKLPKELSCTSKKAQEHVVATVHVIDLSVFLFFLGRAQCGPACWLNSVNDGSPHRASVWTFIYTHVCMN